MSANTNGRNSKQPDGYRRMLGDQAYTRLREEILGGDLAPGERVTEVGLAARLEISRTPIREALRRLETEQMLERGPSGLRVTSFDASRAYEVYLLRELVEPECAHLSAPHLTTLDLARLDACVVAMDDDPSQMDYAELNNEFHDTLLGACPYPRLLDVVNDARDRMVTYRLFVGYDRDELHRSNDEHRTIAAAAREVARGAADTAGLHELVRDHIRRASSKLISRDLPH